MSKRLFLCNFGLAFVFFTPTAVDTGTGYRIVSGFDCCVSHSIGRIILFLQMSVKGALYRIWCGVNRLGDSGVKRLGDTSAFVIPAGQLLLTRQSKTRMYTVGIVFEFYTVPH